MRYNIFLLAVTTTLLACGSTPTKNPSSSSGGSGGATSGSTSSSGGSTGSTTGTTSSSGGTTGGTTGSSSGASCNPSLGANDLADCTSNADCSCPEQCVTDHGLQLCEIPCPNGASDCTDVDAPQVKCQGGFCALNFCGQAPSGPAAGAIGAPCDISTSNDGMCTAVAAPSGSLIGFCFPIGTVSAGGDCADDQIGTDLQCVSGQICPQYSDAQVCSTPCAGATCTAGQICLAAVPGVAESSAGYCGACLTAGTTCNAPSDCCSGLTCSASGTCGT
jgi:hypothetical protein